MMAIIGATIGGLWIYNVFNLRKLVRGQLDWVYSTPLVEECIQQKSCIKNYPDFTLLYIAAVSTMDSCYTLLRLVKGPQKYVS